MAKRKQPTQMSKAMSVTITIQSEPALLVEALAKYSGKSVADYLQMELSEALAMAMDGLADCFAHRKPEWLKVEAVRASLA